MSFFDWILLINIFETIIMFVSLLSRCPTYNPVLS